MSKELRSPSLPPGLYGPGPPPSPNHSPEMGYMIASDGGTANYGSYSQHLASARPCYPVPMHAQIQAQPSMLHTRIKHNSLLTSFSDLNFDTNNAMAYQADYHHRIVNATPDQLTGVAAQKPHPAHKSRAQKAERPPSLSATHPYQYRAPPAQMVAPSQPAMPVLPPAQKPLPYPSQSMPTPSSATSSYSNSTKSKDRSPQPRDSSSPVFSGKPWERSTDPMGHVLGSAPNTKAASFYVPADLDMAVGNVTSPTAMHVSPFGTLIEVANRYPSDEDETLKTSGS